MKDSDKPVLHFDLTLDVRWTDAPRYPHSATVNETVLHVTHDSNCSAYRAGIECLAETLERLARELRAVVLDDQVDAIAPAPAAVSREDLIAHLEQHRAHLDAQERREDHERAVGEATDPTDNAPTMDSTPRRDEDGKEDW